MTKTQTPPLVPASAVACLVQDPDDWGWTPDDLLHARALDGSLVLVRLGDWMAR
jgi:hypothetical protein